MTKKAKIKAALADGSLDFVIGTQALLSDGVEFSRAGVIVTDEQHRFGVDQRATLSEKSKNAHTLVMSATPIPRSLALAFYGDLDMSVIDEMPPGRQRVDTFVVDENYRERLIAFIRKTVSEGGQVYVVCPSIEENATQDSSEVSLYDIGDNGIAKRPPLKAAIKYADELSEALPELTVAFLHGKLKSEQKDAIMTSFECGDINVLVSTTVIEVGVNVPNASLMIVENAERFGLSQLHQLRGRVGRSSRRAYAYFTYPKGRQLSEISQKRLEAVREYAEFGAGFRIALRDMEIRGAGNILGAEQHGHLEAIGYDLYIKLLNDAVLEEKVTF